MVRKLLSATPSADPLARMAVLFVPAFNIDGHERDYMKADTPEMRANVTDGADLEPFRASRVSLTKLTFVVSGSPLDSFAAWGFFNAWFEQKDHLETYVAAQIARRSCGALGIHLPTPLILGPAI